MTPWDQRIDDAIGRTETTGVSPIRAVPIDMIAHAVLDIVGHDLVSDAMIDRGLFEVLQRNHFPTHVALHG